MIAPSIMAADLGNLRAEARALEVAGADRIHIDIMDGVFVPNLTFGVWILDVIRQQTKLPLDCHLMVSRPQEWISELAKAGANQITIHIESTLHIHRQIETIQKLGLLAGISLNPGSPISLVEELLDYIDIVQVMGVDPGFSGQKILANTWEKICRLKTSRGSRHYLIEVDGGISLENIASLRKAGGDIFVLGSSIFSHPNKIEIIAALKKKLLA